MRCIVLFLSCREERKEADAVIAPAQAKFSALEAVVKAAPQCVVRAVGAARFLEHFGVLTLKFAACKEQHTGDREFSP